VNFAVETLMKTLYPPLESYRTFFLETQSQHRVYIEESGNPDGIPVIFLHGGPCSGTKPDHRRFFNPELYRIILMDQRACGLSLPFGEIEQNTTQDLMNDMEQLRQQLAVEKWLLFGGSWGAALALLYAQSYPDKVSGMILRGTFLARQTDLDWFLEFGAGRIYPELWQRLLESVPDHHKHLHLLDALYAGISGNDEVTKRRVAKAWMAWGAQVALGAEFNPALMLEHVTEKDVKQVQMELHYAKHFYFVDENQILENCQGLADIPTVIIHGRYDLVCPIEAAVALHKVLPQAEYVVLPNAGHIAKGDDMIDALVNATDNMAEKLA
jgi:proline iminopeptidase